MFNISPWFEIGKRYDRSFISVNYKYVKVSKDYKKNNAFRKKILIEQTHLRYITH